MRTKSIIKRVLLVAIFILGGSLFSFADTLSGLEPISFQVGFHDPTNAHGELPRGTVNPPSACLDDHTLYLYGEHSDYTLYLVDTSGEEPNVVYQVYVPANVSAVVLPATLVGTYELQLYGGGEFYYYSEIEL